MTDQTELQTLSAEFPAATHDAWMALVAKVLKGADFNKRLVTRTLDGLSINPLYTRTDALPGAASASPGEAPFTRGNHGQAIGSGWDIRQFHSHSDAKAANAAIMEDLQGGVSSIALHVAAPGTSGLPVDAIAAALDGVLLDLCPISLIAGENATTAADALMAEWTARKLADDTRLAQFNDDPLGTLARSGTLSQPLAQAMTAGVKLIRTALPWPNTTALVADGNAYHAGGASDAQELAAILATLVSYLRAAEADGIGPDQALPKIAVSVAADADQFTTIAKLRALRQVIWRIADACGAGDAARRVPITAVTAWRMMARRDPWTNIMRTTLACSGAAFGGANAITVLPFTYPLGQTDSFARRVARNVQIVLQEESNLGRVIDPAGGSWYVEKLTSDLAEAAWTQFQAIEARGGMAAALTSGALQDEIAKVAATRARDIATGRIALTGVSAFPKLGDDGITTEPWPAAQQATADPAATVTPLAQARLAEPFERLRDAADAHAASSGSRPTVFIANLGEVADYGARVNWIRNFLASGGIDALIDGEFQRSGDAGARFADSGSRVACIVSSDAVYAELGEATAHALKSAGAEQVMLAGRPPEQQADLKEAGVDRFWYAGQDAVAALSDLHNALGIAPPA